MDLFNREIVSHSISPSPNLEQIRAILTGLFKKLPNNATPVFHSDQGCNIKMQDISVCFQNATFPRVCPEKVTICTTEL